MVGVVPNVPTSDFDLLFEPVLRKEQAGTWRPQPWRVVGRRERPPPNRDDSSTSSSQQKKTPIESRLFSRWFVQLQ